MEPHLPHEIMYRPKMGFSVPLARWFRGPLKHRVEESIAGRALESTGIFDTRVLRHLFDAHVSGRRDYSAPLWTVLMFDAFLRNGGLAETESTQQDRVA
jgi:asparagine synthase (glutamine-hydrolysing)